MNRRLDVSCIHAPRRGGRSPGLDACAAAQTDGEIRSLVATAGGAKDYPDAAVVSVFDRMDVTVEESGPRPLPASYVTKILTMAARSSRRRSASITIPPPIFINIESIKISGRAGRGHGGSADLREPFRPGGYDLLGCRMKVVGLPRLEVGMRPR